MIPLLPRRKLDLFSPNRPEEVAKALSQQVEPRQWLRFNANRRFEGTVTGTTFDISRIISYRNSFVPQIRGVITPDGTGSRISISMGLHWLTLTFLLVWIGLVCSVGGAFALGSIGNGGSLEEALIPVGMFVFAWALSVGGFWFEAWKAEKLLSAITDGTRQSEKLGSKPEGFY